MHTVFSRRLPGPQVDGQRLGVWPSNISTNFGEATHERARSGRFLLCAFDEEPLICWRPFQDGYTPALGAHGR